MGGQRAAAVGLRPGRPLPGLQRPGLQRPGVQRGRALLSPALLIGALLLGGSAAGCGSPPLDPPGAPAATGWPEGLVLLAPDPGLPPATLMRLGTAADATLGPEELTAPGWPEDAGIRYEVEIWDGDTRSHHFALDVVALGGGNPGPGEQGGEAAVGGPPMNVTMTTSAGRRATVTSRSASVMASIQGPLVPDGSGSLVFVSLPRDFLAAGFTGACELGRRLASEGGGPGGDPDGARMPAGPLPTDAELRPMLTAMGGLIALLDLVQGQGVLREVLFDLVDTPSLWSVVANMGVSVSVTPGFGAAWRPAGAPVGRLGLGPCWAFPLTLKANDEPALEMVWYAVPPGGPLTLGGGVVAITGQDPSDPSRRLTIRWADAWHRH